MSGGNGGDGGWRKSSHSNSGGCVEVGVARTSSHSALYENCVEVTLDPDSTRPEFKDGERVAVQVRDSKDPDGPVLSFTAAEWGAFVLGAKDGEFDLPDTTKAAPRP